MNISRQDQIKFVRELLPLVEAASDEETLNRLHNLAALILTWSGFEDNGVAFAISEYTYELAELARGKEDTGWKDAARKSLLEEISEIGDTTDDLG